MTQYNTLNIKLSDSQISNLKSEKKNGTEEALKLWSNVVGDFNCRCKKLKKALHEIHEGELVLNFKCCFSNFAIIFNWLVLIKVWQASSLSQLIISLLWDNPPGKYMFVEHSWNILMIHSRNIWKKFPMKFQGIFPNNVSGILNIGVFLECSMNILRMLRVYF